jgi:uncharacterized membrane-anchored protein
MKRWHARAGQAISHNLPDIGILVAIAELPVQVRTAAAACVHPVATCAIAVEHGLACSDFRRLRDGRGIHHQEHGETHGKPHGSMVQRLIMAAAYQISP